MSYQESMPTPQESYDEKTPERYDAQPLSEDDLAKDEYLQNILILNSLEPNDSREKEIREKMKRIKLSEKIKREIMAAVHLELLKKHMPDWDKS
jgi:hypothetical protein